MMLSHWWSFHTETGEDTGLHKLNFRFNLLETLLQFKLSQKQTLKVRGVGTPRGW